MYEKDGDPGMQTCAAVKVSSQSTKPYEEGPCPFKETPKLSCGPLPRFGFWVSWQAEDGFQEVAIPLAHTAALILPNLQFLALGHDPKQEVPLSSSKHGMWMKGGV